MNADDSTTRRIFVQSAASAATAAAAWPGSRTARARAPAEQVNVGLIGVGIRGYQQFLRLGVVA